MELLQAIKARRSIRKYRPDEISQEVLESILKNAMWAPSGMNTQPWKFIVLTGEKKQAFLDVSKKAIVQLDARLRELFNEKMRTFIEATEKVPLILKKV